MVRLTDLRGGRTLFAMPQIWGLNVVRPMTSSEALTKIQAVERLVDSSIRLLFRYEDPLSVQLLAASAYRVLRDLADKQGGVEIRETEISFIQPEKEGEYYAALNEVANFLKHADRDPQGVLEPFDEKRNDLDITSCVFYLSALGSHLSVERLAFLQWCAILYPNFFKDTAPFQRMVSSERYAGLTEAPRGKQLAVGEELVRDLREVIRNGV